MTARRGLMMSVTGEPGSGKSSLIRSASALGTVAVACLPPSERDSYTNAKGEPMANIEPVAFADDEWFPLLDSYKATAFMSFFQWLAKQAKRDDLFLLGVDTGSILSEAIMHDEIAPNRTGNPMDIAHGRAYGGHNAKMLQVVNMLRKATGNGTHVLVAWHGQMREQEGAGDAKPAPPVVGEPHQQLTFEDRFLPAMHGSLRQRIGGEFSLNLYANIEGFGPNARYLVSALPGRAEPAKARVKFKEPAKAHRLPNDMAALLEALE